MRLAVVSAARPNFMKVAPLLRALDQRGGDVEATLVHTGQHYDDAMAGAFFRDLDIRPPDVDLGCGSGTHAQQTAAVMVAFEAQVERARPDAVVVVGDVNSTLACTLVSAKAGIPVAHVEAGLRSGDRSMPEEVNRICVDHLSDWLLTPSPDADANLAAEGIGPERVFRVGNVMVDTLLHNRARAQDSGRALEQLALTPGEYVLVTLHRPSNVDDDRTLAGLVDVLLAMADDRAVVFPVHPRTRARLAASGVDAQLESKGVRLTTPMGYLDFLQLMDHAALVVTDSGGIQEETTVLGVPCLTVRETTERPITVAEGTNRVVGTDPAAVLAAYRETTFGRSERRPALWDGCAGERMAEVLCTVPPPLAATRRGARQ